MVVVHGVHAVEEVAVALLPVLQLVGLALNGPQVVVGRLGDGGHTGDEHCAAVGLDAHACTVLAEVSSSSPTPRGTSSTPGI